MGAELQIEEISINMFGTLTILTHKQCRLSEFFLKCDRKYNLFLICSTQPCCTWHLTLLFNVCWHWRSSLKCAGLDWSWSAVETFQSGFIPHCSTAVPLLAPWTVGTFMRLNSRPTRWMPQLTKRGYETWQGANDSQSRLSSLTVTKVSIIKAGCLLLMLFKILWIEGVLLWRGMKTSSIL